MITIQDLISTTVGRRIRGFLNKSATTPIPNWDSNSPLDLPQPDIGPVMDMIRERVAAHAAAGTLDEAHGDLLDRVIRPICRQWSQDARHAYEEQLRLWNYIEEQGTAHSIEKGQELARLNIELARYQEAERRVWARFDDEVDTDHITATDPVRLTADPLPAPAVPRASVITESFPPLPAAPDRPDHCDHPTESPDPAGLTDDDGSTPRIHSV